MFSRHGGGRWSPSTFSMALHLRHGCAGYVWVVMLGCSGLVVRVDGRKPLLSMDDPLSLSEDFRRMGRDLRHVGDRMKSGVDLDRGYLYIVAG